MLSGIPACPYFTAWRQMRKRPGGRGAVRPQRRRGRAGLRIADCGLRIADCELEKPLSTRGRGVGARFPCGGGGQPLSTRDRGAALLRPWLTSPPSRRWRAERSEAGGEVEQHARLMRLPCVSARVHSDLGAGIQAAAHRSSKVPLRMAERMTTIRVTPARDQRIPAPVKRVLYCLMPLSTDPEPIRNPSARKA